MNIFLESFGKSVLTLLFIYRYFAICRPLQYKPSASFYIVLVFATSLSVNVGRFLEFRGQSVDTGLQGKNLNVWKD